MWKATGVWTLSLSLSVLLGLQAGLEYFNLYECWLLFCGEFHNLMEERVIPLLFQFLFFLIFSDGKFLGNRIGVFVLNQLNVIKLPWDARHGAKHGWIWRQIWPNSWSFPGWEISQMEGGQLCEDVSSSQGSLESALKTLCLTQAVLYPGQ